LLDCDLQMLKNKIQEGQFSCLNIGFTGQTKHK